MVHERNAQTGQRLTFIGRRQSRKLMLGQPQRACVVVISGQPGTVESDDVDRRGEPGQLKRLLVPEPTMRRAPWPEFGAPQVTGDRCPERALALEHEVAFGSAAQLL